MKTLRDLLPFIAYGVQLQIMKADQMSSFRRYDYMFSNTEFIDREVLETHYPELLDKELSDGIHGEGIRDGIYIHLYM